MSSIVKKSSHFVPKAGRRQTRAPLASPPATQVPKEATQTPQSPPPEHTPAHTQAHGPPHRPSVSFADTPPTTQAPAAASPPARHAELSRHKPGPTEPMLLFQLAGEGAPVRKPSEAAVDPVAKADIRQVLATEAASLGTLMAPSESALREDSDSEEYGDNDIFKQPLPDPHMRRRSSIASARRLSVSGFRRSNSVLVAGPDQPALAPVPILIPVGKPVRKRKLSALARTAKRALRGSIIAIPKASDVLREEQPEGGDSDPAGTAAGPGPSKSAPMPGSELGFVVGLNPATGKLQKYRVSAAVEGHDDIPVAPADLVTTVTEIRQIPRRITKEDQPYFAKVAVLADTLSMADLCKPNIQIGVVSEKFEMAEQAKQKIARKKEERRDARAIARKRRIPYEDALREVQGDVEETKPAKLDLDQVAPAPEPTSQLKLNLVGGQMVVDIESTVVLRGTAATAGDRQVEIENPFENPITSNSFTRQAHTDTWTTDEVIELYNALSTWGTDFTFIAQLFPYRTRRQVKRKFTLEEKRNPQLVELALRRKLPPDFSKYCLQVSSKAQFKSVDEFNKEMAQIQREHDLHLEEINTERERAIKEDLEASRKREIEYRTGSKPMSRAEKVRELRRNEQVVGTIDDVKRPREEME